MKQTIAIITGGDSSELVISLRSAARVKSVLDENLYDSYIVNIRKECWNVNLEDNVSIPVNRNNFSFMIHGEEIHFDFAFLAMHGPPGEDGKLQAYFDLLGIPYSSSGVLPLALSFNKFICKSFLGNFGIPTARAVFIPNRKDANPEQILVEPGLPCFVKPNCGGSSFGVSKVTQPEQLIPALEIAWKEDNELIIEEALTGHELTCGLVKFRDRQMIFPLTQIVSKKEFFDYEAKYTSGLSDEITPAEIPVQVAEDCRQLASRIYDLIGCKGIVRIDFILSAGKLYFLELNGIPGMTPESIVPKQIRTYGLTEQEIYTRIIQEALPPV
jgi:D-alanine-D-alanine ligase